MAKKVFTGTAPTPVAQVDHVTPANVEIGDGFYVLLANRLGEQYELGFIAGAGTVQNVVEGLKAAGVAAKSAAIAPWDEVTCTEDDTKLIVTGTAGEPYWVTTRVTNVGGGADTQTLTRSASVACAGPHIFSDPVNWTGGALPVAGDDLVVAASCPLSIYGEQFTAAAPDTFEIEPGYAEPVGSEARPLWVALTAQAHKTVKLAGTGASHIRIDAAASVTVRDAAGGASGEYGLNLTGNDNDTLLVQAATSSAKIGVAALAGQTAEFDELHVASGIVVVGPNVTAADTTPVELLKVTGGTILCRCPVDAIRNELDGGSLMFAGTGATVASLRAWSGKTYWDSVSTITDLYNGQPGAVDFSPNLGAMTVTNCYLYRGYSLRDPSRRVPWTNKRRLLGCGRADGVIDLGVDYAEGSAEL